VGDGSSVHNSSGPRARPAECRSDKIWIEFSDDFGCNRACRDRPGVSVHVPAPTIHAGFGYNPEDDEHPGLPIRLENFNVGNQIVVLETGMPIRQLILEEVREVPTRGYQGCFSAQQSFTAS